ncbi:MAG: AmmeMemoRadiSam system protein B [Candidatus Omnitrophota bacterium]
MKTRERIRTAAVSGQFYNAEPEHLRQKVRGFLADAKGVPSNDVRAIIVPHAGHEYSGQVAAEAYKLVEGRTFESVVVVAFLHRVFAQGVLVDDVTAYETPLGRIPVDLGLAGQIRQYHPSLQNAVPVRLEEHSLEVQLPFLQEAVPGLKIVPIYIGIQNIQNVTILADALAKMLEGRNVLVVVTTDLSHFHPYEIASQKDQALVAMFEKGDVGAIYDAYTREEAEACGMGPVLTSILLARKMKWSGPYLLQYANSGDVTGDRSSVVGYAAMVFRK